MTSIPSFSRPVRRTAAVARPAGGRDRLLLPLAVVAAVALGLAGWLFLVSPVRADTASVQAQAATVTQQVDGLRSQLAGLRADRANLPRYQAELQAAQAALPTTAAMPAFLRTLQDLGTSTGTSVTALNATAPDGKTVAAGTNGMGNVYTVPVTITVTGSYDGLTAFVRALQAGQPRAVLVDTVDETAAVGGSTTLTISMTAFVAPTAGATGHGG